MAHHLLHLLPSTSAGLSRFRRCCHVSSCFSPYHGRLGECSLIFLAGRACISVRNIVTQTMAHRLQQVAPSNSTVLVRYRRCCRVSSCFSPYHGRLGECNLIFLADNTCILERNIVTCMQDCQGMNICMCVCMRACMPACPEVPAHGRALAANGGRFKLAHARVRDRGPVSARNPHPVSRGLPGRLKRLQRKKKQL